MTAGDVITESSAIVFRKSYPKAFAEVDDGDDDEEEEGYEEWWYWFVDFLRLYYYRAYYQGCYVN